MPVAILKNIAAPLLDFIYPPVCFTCERRLENADDRICSACRSDIKKLDISTPVWHELEEKFSTGGVIDDFTSCYLFEKEGKLQQAIHLLKYQGMHSVGTTLGRDIGKKILNHSLLKNSDYVVAIPLHKLKQRERGYNQSVYIARGISETTSIPIHTTLLRRKRYTETQTKLNIDERKANVSQAFEVHPKSAHLITGKSFILMDDIITTGSTISECGRILKQHGAAKVFAASVGLAE
jgi:ComF family protein